MKQHDLKQMYGSMPESFQHCVSLALKNTEGRFIKRKPLVHTVYIVAAILVLLMAVAYAVFSSQVAEFFGRLYGNNMQSWLEKGDVAATNQSFTLDGVTFTLDEVIYRNNGLYGVGNIRPQDVNTTFIIPEDHLPDEPFGYDIHGEGGRPEEAPADTPTIADRVREKEGRLLVVRTLPNQVGVDGGTMLSPGTIGYAAVPQRDGSIRFAFELSDAYAVQEGEAYTIQLWASICEMALDGKTLEDTRHGEYWTAEIKPTPISAESKGETQSETIDPYSPDALPGELSPAALAELEMVVPDAYTQTGTLPVYLATARDFSQNLRPEVFNQSGIVSRNEWSIVYSDEAVLSWAPEALFYNEYSGTFNANLGTGAEPDYIPRSALSKEIADLASWAITGWPGDGTVYSLEKTTLTAITLDEAKEKLETLLDQLGVTGYTCDYALDMSVERILTLGSEWNTMIVSGEIFTNLPPVDFNQAKEADEGFYLSYHKTGDGRNQGNGDIFSVYAYVTTRGVVDVSIRDMYVPGEVYDTPETLVRPEHVLTRLPGEIAASRFPGKLVSVSSIQLSYAPMRASSKADGMILSPIWLIIYQDESSVTSGYNCWAEFDAVDGKLLNAIFK